jgi:hypothetical protein
VGLARGTQKTAQNEKSVTALHHAQELRVELRRAMYPIARRASRVNFWKRYKKFGEGKKR